MYYPKPFYGDYNECDPDAPPKYRISLRESLFCLLGRKECAYHRWLRQTKDWGAPCSSI